MKLESNSQFKLMDENYLFESMGLTNATEEKLHEIFDKNLNQYLKTQMVLTDTRG